jgi:hypothetical protein
MEIKLRPDMFINNKYHVRYGNREAMFTIIDETYAGLNNIGRVNRITVLVRKFSNDGGDEGARLGTVIIGLGDGIVGVASDNPLLKGKVMTKDNMEECVIFLYEDEE